MNTRDLADVVGGRAQMVHRLRQWEDGDTLYGVAFVSPDGASRMGKTFRDGHEQTPGGTADGIPNDTAEEKARKMFEGGLAGGSDAVAVLYRATVRNPRTDPGGPSDPGEPPLKFGDIEDVEVLDRRE